MTTNNPGDALPSDEPLSAPLPRHSPSPRLFFPALVTLLSAFLLFQVQPLISKAILPWFGGSPAVWTTAMLFFQLVLLAGYTYAHLLTRVHSRGWQLAIHVGLLTAAILTLPITPSEAWKPTGATPPAGRILLLLLVTVGLPYFLLSATAPLVQAWFARLYPGRSPYRLYSLSNVGSLAALLTYPFVFEPAMTTVAQAQLWSLGFILFAFACALFAYRASDVPSVSVDADPAVRASPFVVRASSPASGVRERPNLEDAARGQEGAAETHESGPVAREGEPSFVVRASSPASGVQERPNLEDAARGQEGAAEAQDRGAVTREGEPAQPGSSPDLVAPMQAGTPALQKKTPALQEKTSQEPGPVAREGESAQPGDSPDLVAQMQAGTPALQKKTPALQEKTSQEPGSVAREGEPAQPDNSRELVAQMQAGTPAPQKRTPELQAESTALRKFSRALWVVLPALAVVVLLSVTNRLCRDVAVVPFLWILPLTLYLLSFIITFDHQRWYTRGSMAIATALATLAVCTIMAATQIGDWFERYQLPYNPETWLKNVYVETSVYLTWLFLACMVCHGELYRLKPEAKHLTAFYLGISAGGAIGGWLVAIVCPLVFSTYYEWNISLVAVYVLAASVASYVAYVVWSDRSRSVAVSSLLFSLGGLILVITAQLVTSESGNIMQTRNFYGVLTIREYYSSEEPHLAGFTLVHGRILHGFQFHDPILRRTPTTYYGPESGPGRVFPALREQQENIRYGVVGLGTGSLAVYGKPGDYLCYYEIDPNVLALQGKYFTYLDDCQADVEVVLGDARICLENQTPQRFDLLVIDAFSGDAIPAHLITSEAVDVYLRHMTAKGLIMFHISNRYVDLLPVLKALAEEKNMHLVRFMKTTTDGFMDLSSDYLVLTYDGDFVSRMKDYGYAVATDEGKRILWTDQFSNLLEVLR